MSTVVDLAHRRASGTVEPVAPLVIDAHDRILRLAAVKARVGLSRASIYRRIKQREFPPSCSLGGHAVGWLESDITRWIAACATGSKA